MGVFPPRRVISCPKSRHSYWKELSQVSRSRRHAAWQLAASGRGRWRQLIPRRVAPQKRPWCLRRAAWVSHLRRAATRGRASAGAAGVAGHLWVAGRPAGLPAWRAELAPRRVLRRRLAPHASGVARLARPNGAQAGSRWSRAAASRASARRQMRAGVAVAMAAAATAGTRTRGRSCWTRPR